MDMSPRYLTYEEYTEVGGSLDETEFNYYAYEAESYIDWYTFNRLHNTTEIPEAVKRCEVYLIRLIQERLAALRSPRRLFQARLRIWPLQFCRLHPLCPHDRSGRR